MVVYELLISFCNEFVDVFTAPSDRLYLPLYSYLLQSLSLANFFLQSVSNCISYIIKYLAHIILILKSLVVDYINRSLVNHLELVL
jgi:hypothetical protein